MKFTPTRRGAGEYTVHYQGRVLGKVRKKEEWFNIARPLTVTTWAATTPRGAVVGRGFQTRRAAASALLARTCER